MKPYFFGYLFVRLAKVLATLIVLAGLAVAAFVYWQALLEARASRYLPNEELGSQLRTVARLQTEAWEVVAGFQPASGDVTPPRLQTADLQTFGKVPPVTMAGFANLDASLNLARSDNMAMKRFLLTRFEAAISEIRNQLLTHAKTLTAAEPPPTATPPTEATPAPELPILANGIYSARLSSSEIHERNVTIENARNTLRVLADQAEKAQNKQILASSITELETLQALLPMETDHASRGETEREENASSPPARGPKAAELVAARLQRLAGEVRQVIISSWASTEAVEDAVREMTEERQRCQAAEYELKRIWQHAGGVMLMVVIGGTFLAFLLLAMTDLTKALLDAATHSGVVADAYRAAATPVAPYEEETQL